MSRSFTIMRRLVLTAMILAFGSETAFAQTAGPRKVSLRFKPTVGGEAFACGRSYPGIGKTGATIIPSDFALYVYDVQLLTAEGREVALDLEQDGIYQNGSLALLDFEDGSGPCSNGNAPMHTSITGSVPEGKYVGVRFVIGVPFERNHLDLTTQPSPLSITRMFWAWNTGHKFARFDAKSTTGKSFVFHLGSTGCTPTGTPSTVPTACAQDNRVAVTFPQFDIEADAIVADGATLFAQNDGTQNQSCMSSPKSAACAPIFAVLGLPFNGSATLPQSFLRRAVGGATRAADR